MLRTIHRKIQIFTRPRQIRYRLCLSEKDTHFYGFPGGLVKKKVATLPK